MSTLVAVAIATPHSWVIRRVDGTRAPGFNSPAAILRRSSAAIRSEGVPLSTTTTTARSTTALVHRSRTR
ncbi:hypothetical protein ACIRYZ_02720 [Kitasatospora sp. NPDC101155]|uniref:hypothetical protein n=1 Tax=Kitasatospora sp. NPDC101155 TaxID=3364097 RepID=UPI00381A2DDF